MSENNHSPQSCPECGEKMDFVCEEQIQEYPGAHIWPGSSFLECPACGYQTKVIEQPIETGTIQENTRGW